MNHQCYFIGTGASQAVAPLQFRALAHELARRGHTIVLLVDGKRTDVEKHDANPATWSWPSRRPTHFRDFAFLFRLIRAFQPDCLIGNFGSTNVLTVMGWLMRVRCRLVWYHTVHTQSDLDWRKPAWILSLLRIRKGGVYALATAIIAVSQAARRDVVATFRVREDKVSVFRNALSDPLESKGSCDGSPSEEDRLVVCAGRFAAIKGQDLLIRAIAALRTPPASLRVEFVGDGPTLQDCMDLATELELDDRVTFTGWVSHSDAVDRMAHAYATVVPSHDEAFPFVVIESLATGTPVVGSDVGGIAEIIEDRVTGRLFRKGDFQDLAEKLGDLLNDPEARSRMSKNARRRFIESFDLKKAVAEQADWLEGYVAARQRDGALPPTTAGTLTTKGAS